MTTRARKAKQRRVARGNDRRKSETVRLRKRKERLPEIDPHTMRMVECAICGNQ